MEVSCGTVGHVAALAARCRRGGFYKRHNALNTVYRINTENVQESRRLELLIIYGASVAIRDHTVLPSTRHK